MTVVLGCPFCGGPSTLFQQGISGGDIYWRICSLCGCEGDVGRSPKQAVSLWNNRSIELPLLGTEYAEVLPLLEEGMMYCLTLKEREMPVFVKWDGEGFDLFASDFAKDAVFHIKGVYGPLPGFKLRTIPV